MTTVNSCYKLNPTVQQHIKDGYDLPINNNNWILIAAIAIIQWLKTYSYTWLMPKSVLYFYRGSTCSPSRLRCPYFLFVSILQITTIIFHQYQWVLWNPLYALFPNSHYSDNLILHEQDATITNISYLLSSP